MTIEDVIRNSIMMLGTCHVMGSESKTFSAALDNLKMVADKLREVKEAESVNVTITTNRGKTFNVSSICIPLLNESKCIIELADERTPAEIIADFDGLETIAKTDDVTDKVTPFDGFTSLVGFQKLRAGHVRLTLEKGAVTNG